MNIDSMIQGNPQALVTSYNGVLVADSLEVADRFGKRHTHVLRSIDDLINQLESQSTQNWADYFIPDDYQDNKNRTQRRFKLTRDGFSLLVMGFTGPAALHWKLLYIEAFNKMEQALRSNVDIRQLVTQITTDVLRTVLPDIRQAVEPPPEIEDGRVHNSRRLDFLYGNDEALPNFLTVYDIRDYLGIGQRQAYELVKIEGFPAKKLGNSYRIPNGSMCSLWTKKNRKRSLIQVTNLVFRVCSCMYVIATYAVVVPWKVPTTLITTIWNRCLPCYSI